MKDFPVFTTQYGAASLILREIPYKQTAYVHVRSSLDSQKLIEECVSFCRMCGAEKIYGSGPDLPSDLAFHTAIWEMRGLLSFDLENIASLFPVSEETVSEWRSICNSKMRLVDNSATLEEKDEKRILNSGGAYFVHKDGTLLGIVWLNDNRIDVIASVQKGAGECILRTVQSMIPEREIILEVASSNRKALELYSRLGFIKAREKNVWFSLYENCQVKILDKTNNLV